MKKRIEFIIVLVQKRRDVMWMDMVNAGNIRSHPVDMVGQREERTRK
jgi:hypothetical protein